MVAGRGQAWPSQSHQLALKVLLTLGLMLLSVMTMVACSDAPAEPAEPEGARYLVRGIVRDTSGLATEPRRLRIHHEAIDDLVGIDGTIEPMRSMAMSLTVKKGLAVPDLAPDEKVSFVLDVSWERSPVALIVAIERISADEQLVLE